MKKKSDLNIFNFNTLSLHAGQNPDSDYSSRALPIYQTTSYVFKNANEASSIFNLEQDGHIYSRISNPTVSALEERLASLEKGIGAICTSSGQAALHLTIATLLNAGDHIISSDRIYGGSRNLLGLTLKRFGINTTFVDPNSINQIKKNIRKNTKLFFAETLGNPGLEVLDIEKISKITSEAKIPFLVDNTIPTPYLCNPFDYGANLILHSTTKFIGGHGIAIGGVVIDSGSFDWSKTKKFSNLTQPYKGYQNLNFYQEFGPGAFLSRARAEGLRDFGASLAPQSAFYIMLGVETLGPRMMKHVSNAEYIAAFLSGKDEVKWVKHPSLKSHKGHKLASKLMPKGAGAIISFGLKGGKVNAIKFIENLKLMSHLANIGDAKSLVIHPASTTHSQLTKEDLKKVGITEDLIRISVGIEDLNDLIKDINSALLKVFK
ncbi:MAG: L-methionine gamma-lyase [Alphaproteobacteria bacterium MarineAlpha9_Bin4]|nr:O-acetylhomoserine aminocarboxypropyltransferase [Pelagibacterales bacterium]PPR26620.1 MAG: L-methionine gamma-lyase [Alphaproteobacteria bacterium MarineAlpha9_Bin4]|tara:strand:- start:1429 stop:2730 length:1302 start_codon:yes stop_codon:yes gene_type:complete